MSDQPKPAPTEWTELLDEAAFRCSATTQDERKRVIYELVNAALAAERSKHTIEVQKLYAEIHNLLEVKQRLMVQLSAARAK